MDGLPPRGRRPLPGSGIAGAAIGGPFTLVDETGATVTDAEVIDRPSLIYFGYTFCPDVCPFDAARNAEAVDLLAARGHDVKPVFISVDPKRDTPGIVGEFTDFLHDEMLGLTGSPSQVQAAAAAYKVFYQSHAEDDPEYYFVDHTSLSYLATPRDGVIAFFRGAPGVGNAEGVGAEAMADAIECHLDLA